MNDGYQEIRPYNEAEAAEALKRLFQQENFIKTLRFFEPNLDVDRILSENSSYKTVYDFQQAVAKDFVEYFVEHTTEGVSLAGIENLDPEGNYLFLANHRDIVFDSALLQYYFLTHHRMTSKIAIGDNLLATPLLEDLGKINKMITVKRSMSLREKLENYRILSDYIHHSICVEHESVWIAQRNGRTKDGVDKTQHGLVKMLSMSDAKNPVKALRELHIVPVSISYELETCAHLKARETTISEHQTYHKKPGEDFESIKQGLFGDKGRVSLVIGHPIDDELEAIPPQWQNKEKIERVCEMVDRQIYGNYKLYPTHYIAHDLEKGAPVFGDRYAPEEKEAFIRYIEAQSQCADVSEKKMRENLLAIYANPVKIITGKP